VIRSRDRGASLEEHHLIGLGDPILRQYERICFEDQLIAVPGKPLAVFVYPGHPLLDAAFDLTLEHHRDLLRQGAILVDENEIKDYSS
jgi:hypothetical protein